MKVPYNEITVLPFYGIIRCGDNCYLYRTKGRSHPNRLLNDKGMDWVVWELPSMDSKLWETIYEG